MKCEICSHVGLIKKNGAFICENCGVKYTVDEVRGMVESNEANMCGEDTEIQLKLARNALSMHDYAAAGQRYKKLADTYSNWETCFYSVYCEAAICAVSDISDNCLTLKDSLGKVFSLIELQVSQNERAEVAEKVFKDAVHIACKQYSRALETFIKVDPSIKSSFVKDLSAQLNSSMAIITHCCEMIRDFFDDYKYDTLLAYGYKKVLECKLMQRYIHLRLTPTADEMLELLDKHEPEFAKNYRNRYKKKKSKAALIWGIALASAVLAAVVFGIAFKVLPAMLFPFGTSFQLLKTLLG